MPACVVAICRAANWRRAGSIVGDDARRPSAPSSCATVSLVIGPAALADESNVTSIGPDRHAARRRACVAIVSAPKPVAARPSSVIADPEMRERAAPERKRQAARAGERDAEGGPAPPARARRLRSACRASRRSRAPAAIGASTGPPREIAQQSDDRRRGRRAERDASRCATPSRSPRFQASEKPNGVRNVSGEQQQRRRSC